MSDIVLETKALTKHFSNKAALENFDLQIPRGCICGFVGRNGAGKTTAIKLMLGFLEPTAGSSTVLDCDSMSLTPEVRRRIGYVTEGHRLFRWMNINQLENFQKPFFNEKWDEDKPSVPGYWQHQGAGTAELMLNYSKLKSKIEEFLAELN